MSDDPLERRVAVSRYLNPFWANQKLGPSRNFGNPLDVIERLIPSLNRIFFSTLLNLHRNEIRLPNKIGDKSALGRKINLLRGIHLLNFSLVHDDYGIRK